MKDDEGTVWFAYPSPNTASYTHFPNYGVKFNFQEEILPGMGYFAHDFKGQSIAGTDKTLAVHLRMSRTGALPDPAHRCRRRTDRQALYDVRLGFRAPAGDVPGQRVFDIKLQGNVVRENCDIAQLAEGTDKAIMLTFEDIPVSNSLTLELVPKASPPTDATAPVINSIEIVNPRS